MRLYIAILTLALQQQCSLTNPETARAKAEQGLKPYFPHAHAIVSGSMLVGITCADLGVAAIKELPRSLDSNPSVNQLKTFGAFMGIRSFALGFPQDILELDLATKQYQVLSTAANPGYARDYATLCNPSSSQLIAPTANGDPVRAESAAVAQLRTINTAEITYFSSHDGNYGTIQNMISAGLLDARFAGQLYGYSFDVRLQQGGQNYVAMANPVGNVGRYSYSSTSDAVIRYSAGPAGTMIGQPVQ